MQEDKAAELAKCLLGSGWKLRLPVSGTSMKPILRSGSLLRIAPLPSGAAPVCGDIVVFQAASGRLVVHRVIESHRGTYRTKGDSSGEPDTPVRHTQLLGKVLGIEGVFFLPLDNPMARAVGRCLNRYYPRLVHLKTWVTKRLVRGTPDLAGEGP